MVPPEMVHATIEFAVAPTDPELATNIVEPDIAIPTGLLKLPPVKGVSQVVITPAVIVQAVIALAE
jgi:hypothetical protein